jgi:hypothetical protein
MQLNEIIEENTLPSISRKTRISLQNLEALVAKDWSRLKKVQALGFISILEREYQIDLSDLREECRAYFDAHAPSEERASLAASASAATIESNRKKPSKGLLLLVILLAAAAGWVLFVSPDGEGKEANTTTMEKKGGFYDSVLHSAKGLFGSTEEEAVPEEVPAVKGAWAEENRSEGKQEEKASEQAPAETEKKAQDEAPAETRTETEKEAQPAEKNAEEKDEARIIQQVKKEQAKAEEIRKQSAMESNMSGGEEEGEALSDISKLILAATAGAAAAPEEQAAEDEKPAPQEKAAEAETTQEPAADETAKEEPAPEGKQPVEEQGVTSSLVIMHPRSKIWVGYTNLRTMKRTAKVTTDDLTFDTATGDYILAVGHGQIDFKTRNGEKKLNDGKRHFFMIAQGDVREISHEEFQRLNKSKVW